MLGLEHIPLRDQRLFHEQFEEWPDRTGDPVGANRVRMYLVVALSRGSAPRRSKNGNERHV